MASLNWALLCEYAFLTEGKTGVIGIFEFIDVISLPSIYPQLFLVVSMIVTPDDGAKAWIPNFRAWWKRHRFPGTTANPSSE